MHLEYQILILNVGALQIVSRDANLFTRIQCKFPLYAEVVYMLTILLLSKAVADLACLPLNSSI